MFAFDTTTQGFDISSELHHRAWQESRSDRISGQSITGQSILGQSILGQSWQVYLNQVCLETVRPWLQDLMGQEAVHVTGQRDIWSMVNGSALTVNTRRFVLIPQEAMDRSEFRVPQEWIDISSWAGDYYLAVEVNADAQELQIWGYTTHQMLKQSGYYDDRDRAYCLVGDRVIQDMTVFGVMQQLPLEPTRAEIAALPALKASQAEGFIQQVSNPAIVLPRLELDFAQWGALLQSPHWLQVMISQMSSQMSSQNLPVVNLGQWFQNVFESGWQAIDEMFNTTPDLAFSFRQEEPDPNAIRRVKRIQFDATLPDVLLVMVVTPEVDDRRRIWVQVLPWQGDPHLPTHLTLTLLSSSGTVMQSVEAGSQSNYIQLRRFKCPPNAEFTLQIEVENATVTESFIS
jgi:Protein of unknown function (DUF1822)